MGLRVALLVALFPAFAWAEGPPAHSPPPASAAPPAYAPPPAKEGYSYPDCYCTDSKGRRVELGQRACLVIGKRQVTARCFMSENTPGWRTEAEGCPTA